MTKPLVIRDAKITRVGARNKSGQQIGGHMTRLRFRNVASDEAKQMFDKKDYWSVALATKGLIIPTIFYVKPKSQGKNNQDEIYKSTIDRGHGPVPEVCKNFDRNATLWDLIRYYCGEWKVEEGTGLANDNELPISLCLLEDTYSGRGLVIFFSPEDNSPLKPISVNSLSKNDSFVDSIFYHLAQLSFHQDAKLLLSKWLEYVNECTVEKDIEQKRDDLERLGIECYFKAQGVDAPAACFTIRKSDKTILKFNMDVELKHDAKSFFNKNEAGNTKKYPRLPMMVMSNFDSANEKNREELLHSTVALSVLLQVLLKDLPKAITTFRDVDAEIERIRKAAS